MKRFHLIFGLVVVIIFLLTGQYMDRYHQHLEFMSDGPRMLYRSRHIYILASGLIHLSLGTYLTNRSKRPKRVLQLIGSLMITTASVLFVIAFFYEPRLAGLSNPFSSNGMFVLVAGVLIHLIGSVGKDD